MSNHPDSPEEVFRAFRKSMLAGDDHWHKLLAKDVSLTGPLAATTGKEQFIEVNVPFFASIRGSELHRHVVSGKLVVTEITTTVAAPGSIDIPLEVSEWYEIENGKITSLRVYFDSSALRAQMKRENTGA